MSCWFCYLIHVCLPFIIIISNSYYFPIFLQLIIYCMKNFLLRVFVYTAQKYPNNAQSRNTPTNHTHVSCCYWKLKLIPDFVMLVSFTICLYAVEFNGGWWRIIVILLLYSTARSAELLMSLCQAVDTFSPSNWLNVHGQKQTLEDQKKPL